MNLKAIITATAHKVPEKIMTNFDLEKLVDTSDEWIKSRTGIIKRHVVSQNEATSDISTKIAKSLLKKSGISAKEIDLIIIGTITPDHFTPSTAALVQKNIDALNAWGFDLSAACSGFLFGLETGSNFIKSGKYKKVMVIGIDIMTSVLDYNDRDTCVIFGDGGGGVILEPCNKDFGIIDSLLHMDGNDFEYSKLEHEDLVFLSVDIETRAVIYNKVLKTSKADVYVCEPHNKWLINMIEKSPQED